MLDVTTFGAVGDGSHDDTTAIQAAINATLGGTPAAGVSATRTAAAPVFLPAGTYKITAPLQVYSAQGFQLVGVGDGSRIAVSGNLTYALDVNGSYFGTFADFAIIGLTSADSVTTAFGLNWSSTVAQRSSTINSLHRLNVRDLKYVTAYGLGIDSSNVQVDQTGVYHCNAYGQWSAGETTWWQTGFASGSGTNGNILNHTYTSCCAVVHRYNVWANACNVTVNGMCVGNGEVDFRQSGGRPLHVHGVRSEASQRLFAQQGGSTLTSWASLADVLFVADAIAADNQFIQVRYAGTVQLTGITVDAQAAAPVVYINNGNTLPVQITAAGLCTRNTLGNLFVSAGASSPASVTVSGYTQIDSGTIIVDRVSFWSKLFSAYTASALPTFNQGLILGAGTIQELSGSGTPEAAVTAPVGSTFRRSDGGTGTSLYVKETGTGNTGWVAHGVIPPDVQWFASSGTWTAPTAAKTVHVVCVSGGGGGGAGACGTAGTARCGGAGGGGGGRTYGQYVAADLPGTVTVTVGAGGTGGVGVASSGSGGDGTSGSRTTFGGYQSAPQGGLGTGGGIATAGAGGTSVFGGAGTSGAGANSSTSGGAGVGGQGGSLGGGGGASGGGVTTGTPGVANNGGNGGGAHVGAISGGGTGGTVDTTTPTSGTAAVCRGACGAGAGGGAASTTSNAQAGAAGALYGGGGAGGGAAVTGTGTSGSGGAGGPGACLVITYFT